MKNIFKFTLFALLVSGNLHSQGDELMLDDVGKVALSELENTDEPFMPSNVWIQDPAHPSAFMATDFTNPSTTLAPLDSDARSLFPKVMHKNTKGNKTNNIDASETRGEWFKNRQKVKFKKPKRKKDVNPIIKQPRVLKLSRQVKRNKTRLKARKDAEKAAAEQATKAPVSTNVLDAVTGLLSMSESNSNA